MSYRDDREALAARLEQVEGELADAQAEITRLRGGSARSTGFLGGPTRIELERTIDGELPESAVEELVELLRSRFGTFGRVERLGRTIAWQTDVDPRRGGTRNVAVQFTTRDGKTRIRLEERMGALAGALFGGIGGGLGGAGAINLFVFAIVFAMPLLALGGVAWLALIYTILRTAFGAVSRNRARHVEALLAELEDAARDAASKKKPVEVRVAEEEEEEQEQEQAEAEERPQKTKRRQ